MSKLSIIIPSRDEKFLVPTIDDIFRNARGEIEVVAVIDSNLWPEGWKETVQRHSPRLHTIFHGTPLGMRRSINDGVASAISRGAKFVAKFDAHCSFSEGFDEILKSECDADWIVVPRRGRLDPEKWTATDTHKPDIDYHYLSFPDDANDFGGPGLNGKPWNERALERKDILIDDEMSSQGSGWFMHAEYFTRLGLMDEASYGPFWNEFQEIGMKAWLSGGTVKINKNCRYLHLHKGSKYGRGYKLNESWLKLGRDHTMKWIWNEAWDQRQIRPFNWLIEHFWPVPSWPENWEEVLYATRKPKAIAGFDAQTVVSTDTVAASDSLRDLSTGLVIHHAYYGVGVGEPDIADMSNYIDVTNRVRSLVQNDSLDIVVNNSTLTPGENPFRGKLKTLSLLYSIDGGKNILVQRKEKDWLIIGPAVRAGVNSLAAQGSEKYRLPTEVYAGPAAEVIAKIEGPTPKVTHVVVGDKQIYPTTPTALNDFLIRKFSISPQRLRGPMPIELRDFHRNDLAQLFAELGFKRGAEIGVAEGNYSEVLLKANPECELLLVDPWHAYSDNPQNKTKEKNEYAYNETLRKIQPYLRARPIMKLSMDAVRDIEDSSLDFVYLDAHHSYPFIMEDLINWTRKVRSGGIVALDDIYRLDEARWGAGPMEAIYDYTRAMRINPWWLIAAHKSVDAFFVKP